MARYSELMHEFRAIVSGRVQMVMFRDFACRKARKIGVTGFVRNLPDGTVEVIAQGAKNNLEKLIVYLHKGSMLSKKNTSSLTMPNLGLKLQNSNRES